MTSKSFYEFAEAVAFEKNLTLEDVLSKVEIALKKACNADGFNGDIHVEFNYEKKEKAFNNHDTSKYFRCS